MQSENLGEKETITLPKDYIDVLKSLGIVYTHDNDFIFSNFAAIGNKLDIKPRNFKISKVRRIKVDNNLIYYNYSYGGNWTNLIYLLRKMKQMI